MTKQFVHIHTHSEYSLLDGLSSPDKLAKHAASLGQPALAITDHGSLSGAVDFQRACKKYGIDHIIGLEAYQCKFGYSMGQKDANNKQLHHLLLLAKNMTGYKNLLAINNAAQLEGFYYKPRIDADFLAEHSEGLIVTTGCMGSEIPGYLSDEKSEPNIDMALRRFNWYLDVFGRDNFFIELQEHSLKFLDRINEKLVNWAKEYSVKMVATNDVHYAKADDADLHQVLLCCQTASKIYAPAMSFDDNGYYMKTRVEMERMFQALPVGEDVFDNSLLIAEMCQGGVNLENDVPQLPDLPTEIMPVDKSYKSYLRELATEGLKKIYGGKLPIEVFKQLNYELKIIGDMNFDVYFLIVWDLCEYAKKNNIWYNVRGSGAGSIVAYGLGITYLDPLKYGLIFERFLNPDRNDLPDFDLDIAGNRRAEMIDYCSNIYGRENVVQICSVSRMKAKSAIRDVGRVMDIPLKEVDRIAKVIGDITNQELSFEELLDEQGDNYSKEFAKMYQDKTYREMLGIAADIEGTVRGNGVHAAAVLITPKPAGEYVPLARGSKSVVTDAMAHFEYTVCESIGLLKVDFLGLKTLQVIEQCADMIKRRHGIDYQIPNIPIDDPRAFELIGKGDTSAIFQLEGVGMTSGIVKMKPKSVDHITAMISLFRPGPMQYIDSYINRMHGKEEVKYRHPALKPILKDTYGIMVYQEQIMQIAVQLAGYTGSDADHLRKAVSKKIKDKVLKHRKAMIVGGKKNGISEQIMSEIFDDIEYFARYGFNKAHAAAYAEITAKSAFLKAHYPTEYMASALSAYYGDNDKVAALLDECRLKGIEVKLPCVNQSNYLFDVDESGAIRYGFLAIKGIGDKPAAAIINARKGKRFVSLDDFCYRVKMKNFNKTSFLALVKTGAFDGIYEDRGVLIEQYDKLLKVYKKEQKNKTQFNIFDSLGIKNDACEIIIARADGKLAVTTKEQLRWENEFLGNYISGHPLDDMFKDLPKIGNSNCADIANRIDGDKVIFLALLKDARVIVTKKGNKMAFAQLEDNYGSIDLVLFPEVWAKFGDVIRDADAILVTGKVSKRDGKPASVIADVCMAYNLDSQKKAKMHAPKIVGNVTVYQGFISDEDLEGIPF